MPLIVQKPSTPNNPVPGTLGGIPSTVPLRSSSISMTHYDVIGAVSASSSGSSANASTSSSQSGNVVNKDPVFGSPTRMSTSGGVGGVAQGTGPSSGNAAAAALIANSHVGKRGREEEKEVIVFRRNSQEKANFRRKFIK